MLWLAWAAFVDRLEEGGISPPTRGLLVFAPKAALIHGDAKGAA